MSDDSVECERKMQKMRKRRKQRKKQMKPMVAEIAANWISVARAQHHWVAVGVRTIQK